MTTQLRTICCKCHRITITDDPKNRVWSPQPVIQKMDVLVSHGYCPECYAVEMAAIEKLMPVQCSAATTCGLAQLCRAGRPHAPDRLLDKAGLCFDHIPYVDGGLLVWGEAANNRKEASLGAVSQLGNRKSEIENSFVRQP